MKAVGMVVEYNPFHNGHLYHLQQTKKETNAECLIAVMSSHFVQRGEPALVSKWARTKMALAGGVDLVVELPYPFAVQTADMFAHGAISILDALHCQEICFGSEHGNIDHFLEAVHLLKQYEQEHNQRLKQLLESGMSYAKAYATALGQLQNEQSTLDLSKPNNILSFHYVKAIVEQQSNMTPKTIQRIVAHYHDSHLPNEETIASATSIRHHLQTDGLQSISSYVPPTTKEELQRYYTVYGTFHYWEHYFPLLKYRLLTINLEELHQIAEVEEGLEHRLKKAIQQAKSFREFLTCVKTKRYTWTRLQRVCTHILTNTTKKEMNFIRAYKKATYIRLLGMNENGQRYLRKMKKKLKLPLITKVATLQNDPIYKLEQKAAQAYVSILPEPLLTEALQMEYATPPLRKLT
ncbi:putative nucleotidyltransferase [Thermolongibacillus altinsuensis]|uniref:tRNA(Met) cytidine acetate ligase n=1 Tax=Thermolongibacillus altinsuensis TaxID=575256 RepID=A0A4R1QPH1_9BACL|nr:nucleotidyltransferase [Thermolongibacillus altinsuensis]TCL50265.1 putative nucleotidyltransferase [Thermolongibacillus altinsuensis]